MRPAGRPQDRPGRRRAHQNLAPSNSFFFGYDVTMTALITRRISVLVVAFGSFAHHTTNNFK